MGVRCRPRNAREIGRGDRAIWDVEDARIVEILEGDREGKEYEFDFVFGGDETNDDVYEAIASPIIQSALDGYNG